MINLSFNEKSIKSHPPESKLNVHLKDNLEISKRTESVLGLLMILTQGVGDSYRTKFFTGQGNSC